MDNKCTRSELIDSLKRKHPRLNKKLFRDYSELMFQEILEYIKNGKDVVIPKFGRFNSKQRNARGFDFQAMETMKKPIVKTIVTFQASKHAKSFLNDED